jgi:holo-[acyl-carrier protein] synthase
MGVVGIGVDAVEIARVERACTRTPSLLGRLYTDLERATCTSSCGRLRFAGLAARFAAKEAASKALGTGLRGFRWRDLEIVSDHLGKPSLRLHAQAAEIARALGVGRLHVSLSTATDLAIAHVVLEAADGGADP